MSHPGEYLLDKQNELNDRREAYARGEKWENPAPAPVLTPNYMQPALKAIKDELASRTRTGATCTADPTNPKDLVGARKVSISCIPPIALVHEAHAMMDGARKYEKYNWRSNPVRADIYIDALLRHVFAWFEGEEYAEDSGAHHLGHARACLGILIDAMESGNLVDNRPKTPVSQKAFTTQLKNIQTELEAKG